MIDKLEAIESSFRLWRAVILVLTIIMLLLSFIGDDDMAIIVLIICLFALILFQLRTLPTSSYQLFILLQMAYLIFLSGKLLETLYYRPDVPVTSILKSAFFMGTLVLFMVVLWRHYQKDQLNIAINDENQEE